MTFVVDASVALAWCFEDEITPFTEAMLERTRLNGAFVPAHWSLEMANALLVGERRQRLTEARATSLARTLGELPITVDDGAISGALGAVLALGRQHGLSAYDAAYLELAAREGLPLASRDTRLREAAARVGVPLLA